MATADPFDRDARVVHGVAEPVAPGVRRVVAANPSPMTFTGTASYLVGETEVAVIDPGPDDPAHVAALAQAAGPGRVRAILVTHAHRDHCGGAAALARLTGAPVHAFAVPPPAADPALGGGEGVDAAFRPDATLDDGDALVGAGWRLTALHTPGHLSDHLCFALEGAGLLFTGDTVMGWSTTLVSPPGGDMGAFMASLERLAAGRWTAFLPGHGRPVADPAAMLAWQLAHRRAREAQIVAALAEGPADPAALVRRLYADTDPRLWPAAERNVLAHLLALVATGRAAADSPPGPAARFSLR